MPDDDPTQPPAPVPDEPNPTPEETSTPAPVPVEVEPQKEPSFVNWTAAEKAEVYEALKKIRQSEPAPIDNKPEPKQPEPKRRKFRFKSKRG